MNKRQYTDKMDEYLETLDDKKTGLVGSEKETAEYVLTSFMDFLFPYSITIGEMIGNPGRAQEFLIQAGILVKNKDGEVELAKEYK